MAIVAVTAAARSILRSTSARNSFARFASQTKPARLRFRAPSRSTLPPYLRLPVELSSSVESLLPYHTVTASALMTSMLSVSSHSYGWLSDG